MAFLSEQQAEAANEFAQATIAALKNERGVHAETAVAGAARMAGTFLFRSFGFPTSGIEPGQPVLSDQANEQGPELINVLGGVLVKLGVPLDQKKLAKEPGTDKKPLLGFLETQGKLEPRYARIRERLGLSLPEAAHAAAAAAALLIRQTSQVLDVHVAFHIAAYGFVEGTKTAPGRIP